jgi:hypothetical protein
MRRCSSCGCRCACAVDACVPDPLAMLLCAAFGGLGPAYFRRVKCARGRVVCVRECNHAGRLQVVASAVEALAVPRGTAAVLLRHFKWNPVSLNVAWFDDSEKARGRACASLASVAHACCCSTARGRTRAFARAFVPVLFALEG